MHEVKSRIDFKRSLRLLLKIYTICGLIDFTYNPASNRVERSPRKKRIFLCVLQYCGISSLVVTFFVASAIAIVYFTTNDSRLIQSERALVANHAIFMILNSFLFSISFSTHRKSFVETINRVIVLSERIRELTDDGSLFYPRSFQKLISLRFLAFIVPLIVQSFSGAVLRRIIIIHLWYLHSFALMELSYWAHLYGNLTLMCFYQKMNTTLNVAQDASSRKLKRRIREVRSISCEIHRVKHKFNDIFNTLHLVCFCGLFGDITCLYKLLKLLVVVGLDKMQLRPWTILKIIVRVGLGRCWASYNMYLNSHIAEGLAQSETIFRGKLLAMSSANGSLWQDPDHQRELDLVLLQHTIHDLETRPYKLFVVNHRSLFAFIKDIVVSYAIVTLQQFTAEYVTASKGKLNNLQDSVIFTEIY